MIVDIAAAPDPGVMLNDWPPKFIWLLKNVSALNVWTPTSCLIDFISRILNSVIFVIILPLSTPSTIICSSSRNSPDVWCNVSIFPLALLKNPLAPDLLPWINAGAETDNVSFNVISVSVSTSNKNRSKTEAAFEYTESVNLKSYTLALPIDCPDGLSRSSPPSSLSLLRST